MAKLTGRRAVVVDNHPLWVDGMARLLEGVGMDVAATSTDLADMVELVREHEPDVLVIGLDTEQADDGLIEKTRTIRTAHPNVKVVIIAPARDDDVIDAAFSMGVSAYCIKSAQPEDLMVAIRQSFERSIFLYGPQALVSVARGGAERWGSPDTEGPHLTKRELEILRLVAEGHSNVRIAQRLWVTDQTVKFHLSNIYRKLNVANRTEASRWAQLHGLLPETKVAG